MAHIRFEGLDELIADLGGIDDLPVEEMLNAGADVTVAAQKHKADVMLEGPYNKDAVKGAIRKGKARKNKDGAYIKVDFPGMQHGNRIAEIAFVNEFGKTNQPARPFIYTANEESAAERDGAAMAAYDAWLKTKGL